MPASPHYNESLRQSPEQLEVSNYLINSLPSYLVVSFGDNLPSVGTIRRQEAASAPECSRPNAASTDGGAGASGVGLSASHISPERVSTLLEKADNIRFSERRPKIEIAIGGQHVKLKASKASRMESTAGGGPRGKITGFSRASRKRLLDFFAQLDRRGLKPPLFVDLTYPADYAKDFTVWKRHLDNFCKALLRKHPQAVIVWRLEFQQRGAPHFHLLVFFVPYLPHQWLARTWYRIVDSGDEKHLSAGTRVEKTRSWKRAGYYVSKYLAKTEQSDYIVTEHGEIIEFTGRMWGVRNRARLPRNVRGFFVSQSDFYQLRRVLRRYLEAVTGRKRRSASRGRGASAYLDWDTALRLLVSVRSGGNVSIDFAETA